MLDGLEDLTTTITILFCIYYVFTATYFQNAFIYLLFVSQEPEVEFIISFYRWRDWGTDKLSNLPKVKQC